MNRGEDGPRVRSSPVRLAVVGPEDFVIRIIETSPMKLPDIPPFQLVAAPYEHERETLHVIGGIRDSVDGFLFTGPVPYDIARAEGQLELPSAYIPLNGASLYGSMVSGSVQSTHFNPLRISVDTLTNCEVHEAYVQLDLSLDNVHVRPYEASLGSGGMAEFHLEMHRIHGTTGALTGLRSVFEKLRSAEVPIIRMVPTIQASRTALRIAVLLASGARSAESSLAAAVIAIGMDGETLDLEALTSRWGDSLLSAQQMVREQARRVGALATPLSASRMLVICTPEAAETLFDGYSANPFSDHIRRRTGLNCSVGVGSSYDAVTAYDSAVTALKLCGAQEGVDGWAMLQDGTVAPLGDGRPTHPSQTPASLSASEIRYVEQLRETLLPPPDDQATGVEHSRIVAAEDVARALALSLRSARRLVDSLVESGVAWALPPARGPQPGRPRRRWRIDLARPLRTGAPGK